MAEYTATQIRAGLAYTDIVVRTLNPRQQQKLLSVLMCKLVVDGDADALKILVDKVRTEAV